MQNQNPGLSRFLSLRPQVLCPEFSLPKYNHLHTHYDYNHFTFPPRRFRVCQVCHISMLSEPFFGGWGVMMNLVYLILVAFSICPRLVSSWKALSRHVRVQEFRLHWFIVGTEHERLLSDQSLNKNFIYYFTSGLICIRSVEYFIHVA